MAYEGKISIFLVDVFSAYSARENPVLPLALILHKSTTAFGLAREESKKIEVESLTGFHYGAKFNI